MTAAGDFRPESAEEERALAFLDFAGSPARAQDAGDGAYPPPGTRVGDFVLERELGRGGMGVVYLARQESLGRQVALKLMPQPPSEDTPARWQRIEREGRILAALRHPAIVGVHAAGAIPGFRYVAMDLVEGASLRRLLADAVPGFPRPGGPGWLPFVLQALHRIAGALGAAHAQGIIHRDVKPENVLVDRDGRAYLVDFGLARPDQPTGATVTRGFVGTPRYAAPEQVRGEPLSAASDVFSFGALAFEAVTGKAAFGAATTHELAEQIQFADPAWPPAPRVPRNLRAVVEKCLEKEPADRYADGCEAEEELRRLLQLEPVQAASRGALSRLWRRAWRRPRRAIAAAALVVLAAAAGTAGVLAALRSSSLRASEDRGLLAEASSHFRHGEIEAGRALLQRFAGAQQAPRGAAALLADMALEEGRAAEAAALYARELERGSTALADLLGARLAQAAVAAPAAVPPAAERPAAVAPGATPAALEGLPAAKDARDLGMLALAHERAGRTDDALAAVERAIALEPLHWLWHLRQGRLLGQAGRFLDSLTSLRTAQHLAPGHLATVRLLSEHLRHARRFAQNEDFLAGALARWPDHPLLLADRAQNSAAWRPRELARAVALAEAAHAAAPDDPWTVATLARLRRAEHRLDEAAALVQAACARFPDDTAVRAEAGWLAAAQRDFGRARTHAEWLAAQPRLLDAVAGLAILLEVEWGTGALEAAVATCERLSALDPDVPTWPELQARLLANLGRHDAAEAAVLRAFELNSRIAGIQGADDLDATQAGLQFTRALILFRKGDWEAAQYPCMVALGLHPKEAEFRALQGKILYRLGQPQHALEFLDEAALDRLVRDDDEAWAARQRCCTAAAEIEERLGHPDTAAEHLEAAVRAGRRLISPRTRPGPRIELANLLHRLGRDGEALDELRAARELSPNNAQVCYLEGVLRQTSSDPAVHDPAAALELLERAAALGSRAPDLTERMARLRAEQQGAVRAR